MLVGVCDLVFRLHLGRIRALVIPSNQQNKQQRRRNKITKFHKANEYIKTKVKPFSGCLWHLHQRRHQPIQHSSLKTILAPKHSQLVAHIAMRKAQPIHIHLFTKGDDFKQFAHFVLRG